MEKSIIKKGIVVYVNNSTGEFSRSVKPFAAKTARKVAQFERWRSPDHIQAKCLTIPSGMAILLMRDVHSGQFRYSHALPPSAAQKRAEAEEAQNPYLQIDIVAA